MFVWPSGDAADGLLTFEIIFARIFGTVALLIGDFLLSLRPWKKEWKSLFEMILN